MPTWRACPCLFALSFCSFIAAEEPLTPSFRVASDVPSYIRIALPDAVSALDMAVEAERPVAVMAASSYYPSESHFDFSNFVDWAQAKKRSTIHMPLQDSDESPCGSAEMEINSCLSRAGNGPGLRCGALGSAAAAIAAAVGISGEASSVGASAPLDHAAQAADFTSGRVQLSENAVCQKYVDICHEGLCSLERGPAVCKNASGRQDSCFCQRGFCEAEGRCIGADLVEPACMRITGQTCPDSKCDSDMGPARCEDGLCICQAGHCAIGGICRPGFTCSEFNHASLCMNTGAGATPAEWRLKKMRSQENATTERRLSGDAEKDSDSACCRRLDTARTVDPGSFARCVARHFFGIDRAVAHGSHMPLVGHVGDHGSTHRELLVSLRVSSEPTYARAAPPMTPAENVGAAFTDELDVRLIISFVGSSKKHVRSGSDDSVHSRHGVPSDVMNSFHTLPELLSPSWLGARFMPVLKQVEAPLLSLDAGADIPVRDIPAGALALRLTRKELVIVRVADDQDSSLSSPGGSVGSARGGGSGVLQMHVVGLTEGSRILYSRAWPEPRSLMDFGHAQLVANASSASVWRATELNARHFAILPSADAQQVVWAFFSSHFFLDPSPDFYKPRLPQLASLHPRKGPSLAGTTRAPDMKFPELQARPDVRSKLSIEFVIWACGGLAFLVLCLWVWWHCRRSPPPSRTFELTKYMPVDSADSEAWTLASHSGRSGSEGAAVETLVAPWAAAADAVISAKEHWTSRLLSASTRAGTSRFGGSSRSIFDDDVDSDVGTTRSFFTGRGPLSHRRTVTPTHSEEEAKGLLLHEGDGEDEEHAEHELASSSRSLLNCADRQAMDALLKLRPAARDSVGDTSECLDESASSSPLIGSERAHYLNR